MVKANDNKKEQEEVIASNLSQMKYAYYRGTDLRFNI